MTEVVRESVLGTGPAEGRFVGAAVPTDTVTCPECGTRSTLDLLRRDASGFCPQCDFPLFWADRGARRGAGTGIDPGPARRSPGVEGELAGVVAACPACGERNAYARGSCVRCGADLTPPPVPVPPPAPAPEPEPQVVYVPVPCGHPPTWLIASVCALLGAGVTFVVTMAVLG